MIRSQVNGSSSISKTQVERSSQTAQMKQF